MGNSAPGIFMVAIILVYTNSASSQLHGRSCAQLKLEGETSNGVYTIDPDGRLNGMVPFNVSCDMARGATIFSHSGSSERMHVNGFEEPYSFTYEVQYRGLTTNEVAAVVDYECYHAYLTGYVAWYNRHGDIVSSWAGAPPDRRQCPCGVAGTCQGGLTTCSCDVNDKVWREDFGYITDKANLPVTAVRAGDTGTSFEEAYITLGSLVCLGDDQSINMPDVDECRDGSHTCYPSAVCMNTIGSFTCSCIAGYISLDGTNCTDIDECTDGSHNCDANAPCSNTDGSFTCTCTTGYIGNGTICTDNDECITDTHNCDANAACFNIPGSFGCTCNAGYSGNGTYCTDNDECITDTHNCDANAACFNIPGSFGCTCNAGYSRNGTYCSDNDECITDTHNCDANAACFNIPGSFGCTCNAGYSRNGTYCSVTTKAQIKGAIDEILNETITADNVKSISDELAEVTETSIKFDEEDLQSVSNKLSTLVGFASQQNLTEDIVERVSESVVLAVDNILNTPESTFQSANSQQVSKNILTAISTLTATIQNTSANNFTFSGTNIVLAAIKVDRGNFPLTTEIGGGGDDVIDFSANEGAPSNMVGVTSVSLPEAILSSVPGHNREISISVFLLNSHKLFQSDINSPSRPPPSERKQDRQPETMSLVGSPILSVTVEGADIKNLPENNSVVFTFPVNESLISENNDTDMLFQRCVYWDIDYGKWLDDGCITVESAIEDLVSCQCSHLTSFAVLLDIKGSVISQALDVISRIGCIASIICLTLILCILLGVRKLRKRQPQQILMNLSFALLALYVTFVIGIDRPTWKAGCSIVAILLHYFCLASLAWMGIEASSMYLMFVRVMNTYTPKLMVKYSLVAWGIPMVVVITTAASSWAAYQNPEYCFILPGNALYFGMILPIGLVLTFNIIIFTAVTYKLTLGRKTFSKTKSKNEDAARARVEAIQRAQNAIAIGTLLGLTWAFGFAAIGWGRIAFNALFAIFNSLQGVFVFLLFGIRQPEVREQLRAAKMRLLHDNESNARKSSASTSGARMTPRPSDVTLISRGEKSSSADPRPLIGSGIRGDAQMRSSTDTNLVEVQL